MFVKPKAVIWDIDDVLTPTSETFYHAALQSHGKCPHPDHWSDYLWGKHIDRDEGFETAQYLIEHRIIEKTIPYDYTESALKLTFDKNYQNILLSARAWHPNPKVATKEWAIDHILNPYIEAMYFVEVEEPKANRLKILSERYDIKAFVEDNPFHAHSAIGIVPEIYLVRRQWNSEHQKRSHFNCVDTALEAARRIVNLV